MTSIGKRIGAARQAIALIRAGLVAMDGDGLDATSVTPKEFLEAMAAQVDNLSLELHWLSLLPDSVMEAPSPDDDEADDMDENNREAGRAKLVEPMLLARLHGGAEGTR